MHIITSERVEELLSNSAGRVIAVIGDLMLDRYFWGTVSRISPEAPVPVIDVESETFHLGGAANVAHNLKSLGIDPLLCGVVGNDNSGKLLVEIAEQSCLQTKGIISVDSRPTTVKTRIIGNNQQIARLDRETRSEISGNTTNQIISMLKSCTNLAGIIMEDYNKGVITKYLIEEISQLSQARNIPLFVDPKLNFFFDYQYATVFKPNRKEAQEALGFTLKTEEDIVEAGKELLFRLQAENILLTLGDKGMMLFQKNGTIASVPTKARHIADVSGAGDTAIATLATAIAGGASAAEAAILANIAAGVVCEEPGIVSIKPNALLAALEY
ncbi:MAG: D-glycero-beta-D-manno-heptose-7-phosphate kinase [Ignavibacteriae bacterium]|nr:D-glycero-beta-D-manno-heptose-7-phosphate kinase [Ignavibacteriota bacterium]